MIPSTWSSTGRSLATFNGKLYAAWKGKGGDETLWFTAFNGTSWAAQQQIPGTGSSVGPAIAAYRGKLYAFRKGRGSD